MAVGDIFSNMVLTSSGGALDILPTSTGLEVVIHNISYASSSVDLAWYDGTNSLVFESSIAGPNSLTNLQFHLTTGLRIRVINNGSTSYRLAYDGVVTRSA